MISATSWLRSQSRSEPVLSSTATFLLGQWRVDREVTDEVSGEHGSFTGTASVARSSPPTAREAPLRYVERGAFVWQGHVYDARRSWWYLERSGATTVRFDDGRYFHDLDLRTGTFAATHQCRLDRYEATFVVLEPAGPTRRFTSCWHVVGPGKRLHLCSTYRLDSNEHHARPHEH